MTKKPQIQKCLLCNGSGKYRQYICVRCGGYGTIPNSCDNPKTETSKDTYQYELESKSGLNKQK